MALKALLIAERNARIDSYPGDVPVACVEVLGAPLLTRIAQRLERCDVIETVVVTDIESERLQRVSGVRLVQSRTAELWRTAERIFEDLESAGVHGVLVLRADHYAEIDWSAVLSHHMHFRNRVTRVWSGDDVAHDMYLISAGFRNEAASLMRSGLQESRTPGVPYRASDREYLNLLRHCTDLHTLAKDALYRLNQIEPVGRQKRPGIWVGTGARVEHEARLVAPVFIGEHARVHGGAVITRDSILEHHTSVDCDTVVEDAHVQPYTAIGAGIDVTHSIVDGNKLFHLKRNVEFFTADSKLLRERKESAAARTVQAAAALLTFVPALFINAIRSNHVAVAACSPERRLEVQPGGMSRQTEGVAKLAPGLAVMRRYGNE